MPLTLDRAGSRRRRRKIAKLREQGLTVAEICKKLGITGGTVSYYMTTPEPPLKGERLLRKAIVDRPRSPRIKPIVIGSTLNGSDSTVNDTALLDMVWARLTVEEKVQAIHSLKRLED